MACLCGHLTIYMHIYIHRYYAYVPDCIHVHIHIHMHILVRIHMHILTHTYVRTMCLYMYVYTTFPSTYSYMSIWRPSCNPINVTKKCFHKCDMYSGPTLSLEETCRRRTPELSYSSMQYAVKTCCGIPEQD